MNTTYKWVKDKESGINLLILQEQTGFWQEHRKKIKNIKRRITSQKVLSAEALLVISRIAYQLQENKHEVNQDNVLQILSFCGLRLEYITNVLFKNRIYRLRQDPGTEDVGLQSLWYVKPLNDNDSQVSTHYNDNKQNSTKNTQLEETIHHQDERNKQKEEQKRLLQASKMMISIKDGSKTERK